MWIFDVLIRVDILICSSILMTTLWQITDGTKFAQLIFSRDKLIDCEFLDDGGPTREIVFEFLDKFEKENDYMYVLLQSQKRNFRHQKYLPSSNSFESNTILNSNITVIHLERLLQIPENFKWLMNLRRLRKKCNQLHNQMRSKKRNDELQNENIR